MSLDSAYLDAFYACANMRNFTKAAARLHITQSALSQRVKNLENDLGATLFIRERTGVRLTEQGQLLLRYCQSKVLMEEEVLAGIKAPLLQAGLQGTIRIGGFSSVMRSVVLPALAPLLQKHQGVQLNILTREVYELPALLRSGEIDFMILTHTLDKEGLVATHLGNERNVLVHKRGYDGGDVYLDHDEEDPTTLTYLRRKRGARNIERRFLDDVYGIIDGVRLGIGKAVVPLHLITKFSDVVVESPDRVLAIPVVLHYYWQPFYAKLHTAVVETLTRRCGAILAG